jgi:hypothetical protein
MIENNVNQRLNAEASKHYNKLNNKINNLTEQLEYKESTTNKYFTQLHNMTNIQLSEMEETLLNKGGKYNMGITPKKCIKQLVNETKSGIRQVNINQQEAIRYSAAKNTTNHVKTKYNKYGIQTTNTYDKSNQTNTTTTQSNHS